MDTSSIWTAERLGDMMMAAAHQWLDAHEAESREKVVGVVVSVCPNEKGEAAFVVGATHDIGNEAIVEILLRTINNLVPDESQLRLVVMPKMGGMG